MKAYERRATARTRSCLEQFRSTGRMQLRKLLSVSVVVLALMVSGCGFFGLADVGGAVAQPDVAD